MTLAFLSRWFEWRSALIVVRPETLIPCLNWATDMRDRADTFGASIAKRGLLGRRLDLSGDAFFTRSRTNVDVAGGSYANNPVALAGAPVLPAGQPAIVFVPAVDFPAVTTRIFEIDLAASYAISRTSNVRVRYGYQRLKAVDFSTTASSWAL